MNQIEYTYKCPVCGWEPSEKTAGGSWDHCPNCLSGTHSPCGGILEPIGVWVKPDGCWEIIKRCRLCGEIESAPLAAHDNPIKVLSIASKPLSSPPFPIEKMEELTKRMGGQGSIGGYENES